MDTVNKIIIIAAIFIIAAAFVYNAARWTYFRKHQHFLCPHCGCQFKPNTLKMIFSGNLGSVGNGKMIKCPKCGKKDLMEPQKDE